MKINREKLLELYMKEVDEICEVADWKTNFGPAEIINIISDIVEKNLKEIRLSNPVESKSFLVRFSDTVTTVYESVVENTTKEAIINLPSWHLFNGNEEVVEENCTEFSILNIKELDGIND